MQSLFTNMLIVSLPQVHQETLLREIVTNPSVDAVRYNTGMSLSRKPLEIIRLIRKYTLPRGKPLYIDLKGKQLRVVEWANLPWGPVVLNHKVRVELPAKVFFRGEENSCELKEVVDGNKIYVDPLPKNAVGRGQAVNIISKKLEIEGGLLDLDYEFIEAALSEGVHNFMLSFVESWGDVAELEKALGDSSTNGKICLKIESEAGLRFLRKTKSERFRPYSLMAARDDLMIHIGGVMMPEALQLIIEKDPNAICASRLLMGLENGDVTMADISDIEYMKTLGYKNFMFSDGISREHFPEAIKFWQEYMVRR